MNTLNAFRAGVALLLLVCCLPAGADEVGHAHRAFSAVIDGVKLGSSVRSVKSLLTVASSPQLLGKVAVVAPVRKLSKDLLEELASRKPRLEALLVVLPRNYTQGNFTAPETERLHQLEDLLTSTHVQLPVFFMEETDRLQTLIEELEQDLQLGNAPSPQTGGMEIAIRSEDAGAIRRHPVINFAGALNSAQVAAGRAAHAPTVLVTAHYDSFSVAPGLASGADSNGSGVVLLLQLLRTFHQAFSGGERGRYNVMFLLTGGGHLNFEGSHQWLNNVDASLLEHLEFVLCLDSLAATEAGRKLYLHYSKPPKDPAVAAWYNRLGAGAAAAGLELVQVHKKINVAAPQLAWPHEHFSRRRLLAATLSALPRPPAPLRRSSLSDTLPPPPASLALAAHAVAHFLAHTAAHPDAPPPDPTPAPPTPDPAFLQHWAALLAVPRMAPFHQGVSALNAALLTFFQEHSDVPTQHVWTIPAEHYEFANVTAPVLVAAAKQHSLVVACVEILGTIVYLGGLFLLLRGFSQGWGNLLRSLGGRPAARSKHKAA